MIDPVSGNVIPNGMQDVRALGMTASNPFIATMAQPGPTMGKTPSTGVMPARPQDMIAPAPGLSMAAPMGAAATPSPFGGRIPQGLLAALLSLSQRNPAMFDQRMQGPMAQRFGITPDMVQGFQPPAQGMGMAKSTRQINPGLGGGFGFAPPAQGGGFDPANLAQQSQLGMDNGKAKNQNIGSVPAY